MKPKRKAGDEQNKLHQLWDTFLDIFWRTPPTAQIPPKDNKDLAAGELKSFTSGPWVIYDGVDYLPPLTIPSHLANQPEAVRSLTESYARYRSQFGDPYLTGEPVQMLAITNPLQEWDFQQRKMVLEQCSLAWERNPLVNAGVTYNRLFAVQNGVRVNFRNQEIAEAIEGFIDNPENDFRNLEKSMLDTLQVEGELFIRFHQDGGEVIWTCVPAWGIRAIEHEPGFTRRVIQYHPQYTIDNGVAGKGETISQPIPAEDIHHVKVNAKAYEQRGRPEVFKILPYAKAYKDWLEQRARQNHYKGSFVLDIKLIGATGAQVAAKRNQYRQPPSGGSVYVHNEKEEAQMLDPRIGAQDASEDGRQIRLMAAAGLRIPEYMLADGSNANLASATAQSLPVLRSFGEWQDIMRDQVMRPTFERVLQAAGIDLDAEVDEQTPGEWESTGNKIKVREAFTVQYPDLESDDPKNLVEALQIAMMNELLSKETATGILPFDLNYEDEQRRIEAEMEKEQELITKGLKPDPLAMLGPNGNQPGEDKEDGSDSKETGSDSRDKETERAA